MLFHIFMWKKKVCEDNVKQEPAFNTLKIWKNNVKTSEIKMWGSCEARLEAVD